MKATAWSLIINYLPNQAIIISIYLSAHLIIFGEEVLLILIEIKIIFSLFLFFKFFSEFVDILR